MDWSKAKNILIAALLIADLILCAFLAEQIKDRDTALKEAAEYAVDYAQSRGISVKTGLPTDRVRMPVLFVELAESGESLTSYRGTDVDVFGELPRVIVSGRTGSAEGELIPASAALILLTDRLSGSGELPLVVNGVEPVYRLDATNADEGATQDTAVPAWRFSTDKGAYYVEGFVE